MQYELKNTLLEGQNFEDIVGQMFIRRWCVLFESHGGWDGWGMWHRSDVKFSQNFIKETRRENSTWET
jgi:hypothetical protein